MLPRRLRRLGKSVWKPCNLEFSWIFGPGSVVRPFSEVLRRGVPQNFYFASLGIDSTYIWYNQRGLFEHLHVLSVSCRCSGYLKRPHSFRYTFASFWRNFCLQISCWKAGRYKNCELEVKTYFDLQACDWPWFRAHLCLLWLKIMNKHFMVGVSILMPKTVVAK